MISLGISSLGMIKQDQWANILAALFDGFAIQPISANKTPKNLDFIMFDGGSDVTPMLYGENLGKYTSCNPKRDILERFIFKHYYHTPTKYIGICRGSQFLNVMMNGTLNQHIQDHGGFHRVDKTNIDTELDKYIPKEAFGVNSTHHQAVKDVGALLIPTIVHSMFRTVEGIETLPGFGDKIRAVQCHPEGLGFDVAISLLKYLFRI